MIGRRAKPSSTEDDKHKGFDDFELRLGDLMRGERATLGKSLLDVQRELKIKATYIAAIENADLSAFETQGFVAGYVRSYARYLGMDPEWAFTRFCAESNFSVAHGMSVAASPAKTKRAVEFGDPLGNPNATFIPRDQGILARVEPGAIGSILVLVTLIGAIGYGGWSVLQEVQRVQLAPIDRAPAVVAQIDPLQSSAPVGVPVVPVTQVAEDATAEDATLDPARVAAGPGPDLMDRLYRPQALDVPVMTSRDGPIASIDPRSTGTLVGAVGDIATAVDSALAEAMAGEEVQVVADAAAPLEILAVRPSWVRVQSADGTVLFEKILDAGERYAVPQLEQPPVLRAGNSGSVYFAVNGKTYGPAAPGASVVKNVALSADALTEKFAEADLTRDVDLARFVAVADASGTVPTAP